MAISDKLTYLNTTKGKIKDSINITGANIGTNDTFRSYSTKLKDGIVDMINNGTETAYNNFPKVTDTGSDITLNNTYNSKLKVNLKGNTYQGDNPQNIETVTGYNEIVVENEDDTQNQSYEINLGKNLCNGTSISSYVSSGGNITSDSTDRYISTPEKIKVKPNTTYTITFVGYEQYTNMYVSEWNDSTFIGRTSMTGTFTTSATTNYVYVHVFDANAPFTEYDTNIQLEQGSNTTPFSPYKTPIEMCKIGTYQDYIYKDNDTWYKMPNILKIDSYNGETITTDYISTTGQLTTGATVYYVNSNPTPIEITDTELQNQLNALDNANSYLGQTNITAEYISGNQPFDMSVSALLKE